MYSASTSYNLTGLWPGVKYQWKVEATDGQSLAESPTWSFSTPPQPNSLGANWQLISIFNQPEDTTIENVLSGIAGKYISVWAYIDGGWKVYDPNNPGFSDLLTVEAGKGYWLNMTQAVDLTVTGIIPSSTVPLTISWNLVGYNSAASQPIGDALASIAGKYISAWAYIDGAWRVYDPNNPGFSDLTTMDPGYGYWINMTETATWMLP